MSFSLLEIGHSYWPFPGQVLMSPLSGTAPIEIGLPEWGLKEQLNKDLYNCSIMIKWFPWAGQFRKTCFHLATFVLPKWNGHNHCGQNLIPCCCCCCDCGRAETGQEQARRVADPVQTLCTWQSKATCLRVPAQLPSVLVMCPCGHIWFIPLSYFCPICSALEMVFWVRMSVFWFKVMFLQKGWAGDKISVSV